MTTFIDLRATPSGGFVATTLALLLQDGTTALTVGQFESQIAGKDLVLATHGFNVSGPSGLKSLSAWDGLCGLPNPYEYVGVLWPGDSSILPVLDYPVEGSVALDSGRLLAQFLNDHATGAASISLVSHSLGARTMLETVNNMNRPVAALILMAGAIEDDCLTGEYADAIQKVGQVRVVASRKDWVLELAFPIGNPIGEVVMSGHPYFRRALGRQGPSSLVGLDSRCRTWQIPDGWGYVHSDYLPGDAVAARMPPPLGVPDQSSPPAGNADGWKSSWSAGVIATQFQT